MRLVAALVRRLWAALSSVVRSLRENWGMGVFALAFSFTLWATVVNEQNPPQTGSYNSLIKVQPVSVPPDLDVLKEIEPVVVRITAPLDVWRQIAVNTFKATVDLSGLEPGEHEVPVRVEALDSRVQVHNAFPSRVTVALDTSESRTLPVKARLQQPPPFGYRAGEPVVALTQAVVTGPAQLVRSVETVVASVDLSASRTDFRQTVRLVAQTARGYDVSGLTIEPASVQVEVPVIREANIQSLAVVAEVRGNPAPGYWLSRVAVRPAAVTVFGPRDVLQPLSFLKTQPFDLTGVTGSVVRPVPVDLPAGVSIVGPNTVEVDLTVSPVRGTAVVRVAPRLEGLSPGLRVTNEVLSLEVTVAGEGPLLALLTPERVSASLNLRGLGAGMHRIDPHVAVPPGFSMLSVQPSPLTVVLR